MTAAQVTLAAEGMTEPLVGLLLQSEIAPLGDPGGFALFQEDHPIAVPQAPFPDAKRNPADLRLRELVMSSHGARRLFPVFREMKAFAVPSELEHDLLR